MKFKKIISVILIGCTTLGLMSCSSSGKKESDKLELTVQVESAWLPYYEKVKETVSKEYPDATIKLVETGAFDHLDVIDATDPTNKDVTDVFALPADRLYGLAKNQVLASLDAEKMAEEVGGFKDFNAGLGGNLKVDGKYLAFPYNIETLVGFVNMENAKKAGIDISKKVEMTSLPYNQLLTVVHDAWYGVAFTNSANFELLNKESDGSFLCDATKNWSELNDGQKQLFEGLYSYWKSHNESKTNLWDKDAASGYIDEEFKTGGSDAIRIDGPWATSSLKELVGSADNLEVIPLTNITFKGQSLTHWKGGWGLGINARVEDDEEKMKVAVSFIEELVNPSNAKELFLATGKVLENADASSYEGIDELEKKVIDATYEGYENAVARPLFTEYGQVWSTWQNSLLSWSAKKPANAEAAYADVQAAFKDMMSQINN